MVRVIHRCKMCSSEILTRSKGPVSEVCAICRLSAEEARGIVADKLPASGVRYGAPGVGVPGALSIPV